MSLRVVVQVVYTGAAAHAGGPVDVELKTFDIDAAALEAYLRERCSDYETRRVIGVEVLP